jgi:adenylate cyclase
MTRAMDLYDPEVHGAQSFHDGQDPGVANLAWQSHYLWILGYPDQALARHQASMALSESIGQPYNLCLALVLGVWLHIRRRDVAMARELDDRCIRLSREHEFGLFINGSGARGWILAQDGDVEGGIACFRDDFAADEAIGFTAYRAYSLNLLSELYLMAGWLDEGIDCADEGIAEARQTGGRHYEAETRRLKGELLLAQGDAAAAETCFRDALQLARQQAAKSWELRAAMSLARLWQQQGRRGEAYELLSGVYGWFTEGFDTPDLQEAQALLAALASGTA